MAYTAILDEEYEALRGISNEAYRLYIELRRYMHRQDGLAFGAGITWTELGSQSMWIRPRQGVKNAGSVPKHKLIQWKDELVREGLLEEVGDKKTYLKFRFPVFLNHYQATTPFSDQNKHLPIFSPQEPPISYPKNIDELETCGGEAVNQLPPKSEKHLPSPISHNQSINQSGGSPIFAMQQEWRPSEGFKDLAKLSLLDIQDEHATLYGETLTEYLMFWSSDEAARYPDKCQRTQMGWERGLLKALLRAKAQPVRAVLPMPKPRPALRAVSGDALRDRNRQAVANWIPPELRGEAV